MKIICSQTKRFDLFDDIKQEIFLQVISNGFLLNFSDLKKLGFKIYRSFSFEKELPFSIVESEIEWNQLPQIEIIMKKKIKRKFHGIGVCKKKYNLSIVSKVYKLRAKFMTFKEIGAKLGISVTWAEYQISHTIHLGIVSNELINKSFKVTKFFKQNHRISIHSGSFKSGSKNINAKLNEKKVISMREKYKKGQSARQLAKQFGISPAVAGYVIKGKTWKHVVMP